MRSATRYALDDRHCSGLNFITETKRARFRTSRFG